MKRDMEVICLEIGKRIEFYREKMNMSTAELAMKINRSEEYVKKIEGDYRIDPTPLSIIWSEQNLDLLFEIAEALQVDVVAFLQPTTEENFQKLRKDILPD